MKLIDSLTALTVLKASGSRRSCFASGISISPTANQMLRQRLKLGEQRELFTFEMFKPKIKSGKFIFNIKPLGDLNEDKIASHKNIDMSDILLFIDDANTSEATTTWQDELTIGLVQSIGKDHADLSSRNLMNANLNNADLTYAVSNSKTTSPTAGFWDNTPLPNGTNSNDSGNATCGF